MATSMGRPSGSEGLLHVWGEEDGALCNRNIEPDVAAPPLASREAALRMAATYGGRRLCQRCAKLRGWDEQRAEVVDLVAALRQSIEAVRDRRGGGEP